METSCCNESRPCSVIITLDRKLYRIPEAVPPSAISLIFVKQCRKVISQTGKFFFFRGPLSVSAKDRNHIQGLGVQSLHTIEASG
jgi:hypothetical protein